MTAIPAQYQYSVCKYGVLAVIPSVNFAILFPSFVHSFKDVDDNNQTVNFSLNPENHTYKGSFMRHCAVDRALHLLRYLFVGHIRQGRVNDFAQAVTAIPFGFNCGFPTKDIANYFLWYLHILHPYSIKGKGVHVAIFFDKLDKLNNDEIHEIVTSLMCNRPN